MSELSKQTLKDVIVTLSKSDEKLPVKRTKTDIKNSWKGKFESLSIDKLVNMEETMKNFMSKRFAKVQTEEAKQFNDEELHEVMYEAMDIIDIKAMLDARYEEIRKMILAHMEIKTGNDDENVKEFIKDVDRSFSREGCGYNNPTIDIDKLKKAISEDEFKSITDEKIEYKVNDKKFMSAMLENPELMNKLKEAVVPGTKKNPRFSVKRITDEERKEMEF